MRVEEHRDAAPAELLQQPAHGDAAGGVERAGRLVEEQELGRSDEGLGEAEPLLHAFRHLLDLAIGGVAEADELEEVASFRGPAARPGEALVKIEHLVAACPPRVAEELREVPEPRSGRDGTGRVAEYLRAPRRRSNEAAGDLDERRLAGAIRTEKADQLTLADLDVDAPQRVDAATVTLLDGGRREGRNHEG
jgi:hypothetical protein